MCSAVHVCGLCVLVYVQKYVHVGAHEYGGLRSTLLVLPHSLPLFWGIGSLSEHEVPIFNCIGWPMSFIDLPVSAPAMLRIQEPTPSPAFYVASRALRDSCPCACIIGSLPAKPVPTPVTINNFESFTICR